MSPIRFVAWAIAGGVYAGAFGCGAPRPAVQVATSVAPPPVGPAGLPPPPTPREQLAAPPAEGAGHASGDAGETQDSVAPSAASSVAEGASQPSDDAGGESDPGRPFALIRDGSSKELYAAMRECFNRGLRVHPNMSNVRLTVSVSARGVVERAEVTPKTLPRAVATCIETRARAVVFPRQMAKIVIESAPIPGKGLE